MKVRCIANRGNALPESFLKPEFYFTKEVEFSLTLGKEYVVYALYQSQGNFWYYSDRISFVNPTKPECLQCRYYVRDQFTNHLRALYICDDNYTYYPMQNPAPLFEIVDSRVSKYWQLELAPSGRLEMAFEQWFTDPCFYDKLTDQEEAEVEIFEKIKELMDAEDFDLPPMDVAVEKLRETVSV